MLRTITLGSCVSVQGIVVGHKPDGRVMIRVDEQVFVGAPVPQSPARCAPAIEAQVPQPA